jgi:dipeptidase E
MRLLLGSGGYRTPERVEFLAGHMRRFFGDIGRLLFVPYALADHDGYVAKMIERGIHAGYELDGIQRHADPVRAVEHADGLFIGGGNTFRLLDALYRFHLIEPIRRRVRGGVPYLGVSAGTNVACPTIRTTNDMPIVEPPSLAALGLVPFQINPHYYFGANYVKDGDHFLEHFGETRDDRLREFHEENATPVIGLWEAGIIEVNGRTATLHGSPARLFRRAQPAEHVGPGEDLSAWLDA